MTPFILLCIGSLIALVGVIAMLFCKEKMAGISVMFVVVGMMGILGSIAYDALSSCPCRIAIIDVNGNTRYTTVKAVWDGRYNQVYTWNGGLNFTTYNSSQVRR